MSYTRDDALAEIRDNLYESSADLWSDAQLVKHMRAEIRSLPRKRIYLEEIHTTTTVQDQIDYVLPTGTIDVELVQKNVGTSSTPEWDDIVGWYTHGGAVYLPYRPADAWTLRIHLAKSFTDPSSGATTLDVPDDKIEVVVWGTCIRAYRQLMGYFLDAKNWDSIGKPDGITFYQAQAWYRDARSEYKELVQTYRKTPRAREINMTG